MERFINYLQTVVPITPTERDDLRQWLSIREYPAGSHLLQAGDIAQAFYFNLQGFVRMYYLVDGLEKTTWFYREQDFISPYASYVQQQPVQFYLQATETTQVVAISRMAAEKLLQRSEKFAFLAIKAMETELIHHQDMVANLLTLSPEQRYRKTLEEQADIFQRVPQHIIASYLGVQPESLSRIKRRVKGA